jgi:hypothetical protein
MEFEHLFAIGILNAIENFPYERFKEVMDKYSYKESYLDIPVEIRLLYEMIQTLDVPKIILSYIK